MHEIVYLSKAVKFTLIPFIRLIKDFVFISFYQELAFSLYFFNIVNSFSS